MSNKTKNYRTPKHIVSAGRAGSASIDLFNGELIVVHDNLFGESSALPIPIKHVYNRNMCTGNGDYKVLESHFGKDWRLNIQQYLIYSKETKSYIYIDGSGNETEYKAKYYYEKDGKEKIEILGDSINNIYTDVDSNLHYTVDGKAEDVVVEHSLDGYSLVDKLTGFKGCNNVEQRTDEVVELKYKLKFIDDELERLKEVVLQKEAYKHSLYAEKTGMQYAWDVTDKTFRFDDNVAHERGFNGELKFPIPIIELGDCIEPPSEVYPRGIYNSKSSQNYNKYKIHSDSYGYDNINKKIADIEDDYERHAKDIVEYKKQKINIENELIKMMFSIPSCYIIDREKNVYAFAKSTVSLATNEKINTDIKDESCVYKLIGISDKHENSISINYDIDIAAKNLSDENIQYRYTSGNLSSVIDNKGNSIKLEYKNDVIHKIIDNRGRVTEFSVQDDVLTSIKYNDGIISNYSYTVDKLSQMTCDGYGVSFVYAGDKVTSVKELSNVVNITNDNITRQSNVDEFEVGDSSSINYLNDHCTVFVDSQGGKATYVFDEDGKVLYLYDGECSQSKTVNDCKIVAYEYDGDNQSLVAMSLINAPELLDSASSDINQTGIISIDKSVDITKLADDTSYILTAWAKATAINVNVQDSSKFTLLAEVAYTDSTTSEYTADFDRSNSNWQYLALPILLDNSKTVVSMNVIFDYNGNSSFADIAFLSLKESVLEIVEYDDRERIIRAESTLTKEVTTYTYRPDDKYESVTISRLDMQGEKQSYTTSYEYNNYDDLVRTIDHDGMVIENTYDEEGTITETTNYNMKDPSSKLYSVNKIKKPEKNRATVDTKQIKEDPDYEQFDDGSSVEYLHGTDSISRVTDKDGNILSYGYDFNTDRLLSVTMNIDGENNTNIYGYKADVLTRLSHNNLNYNYEYDGYGKLTKVLIAGEDYATNTYSDPCDTCPESNVKTIFATGEGYSTCTNDHDQITTVKYIDKSNNEQDYIKNEYCDKTGLLIASSDYSGGNGVISIGSTLTNVPVITNIEYNKFGQPTKSSFIRNGKSITETTVYHKNGNVTDTQYKIDDVSLDYKFSYEDKYNGKLTSVALPNGSKQVMSYDELGRTNGVDVLNSSNQSILSKEVHYMHFGDRATSAVSCVWYATKGIVSDSIRYEYDIKGNISKIKNQNIEQVRYQYDAIGRITREDNKRLKQTYSYCYNAGGNIVDKFNYDYTIEDTLADLSPKTAEHYSYKSNGWTDQLMSHDTTTYVKDTDGNETVTTSTELFAYDDIGNPKIYKGKSLDWSHGRQLDVYDGIEYTYNSNGMRTSKVVDNVTTNYYMDDTRIIHSHTSTYGTTDSLFFHYGNDGITGVRHNNKEYIYRKNSLGDITHIFDMNGTLCAKYVYDAWGNQRIYNENAIDITDETGYTNDIANINPFRYRGYYYDIETGLYYLKNRYYDPTIGRFISADDVAVLDATEDDINGLNLYVYCYNNPVNDRDDCGDLSWWKKLLIGVAVIVAVVAVAAITVATAGAGSAIAAVAIGAAKGAMVGAAVGAAQGAVIGGVTGYIEGGTAGILSGMVEGAADGFMMGAITGAVTGGYGAGKSFKSPNKALYNAKTSKVKAVDKVAMSKPIVKPIAKPVVRKNGVFIENATKGDFTDEAWDIIGGLDRSNGFTKSTMTKGRNIHSGFKNGIGKEHKLIGGRADFYDKSKGIIYELKPNNRASIRAGIKQLHRYNKLLGSNNILKLILY